MKIAILGGAFNPPHLAHQLIAEQILQFTETDQVWLTPCYQHTFDKSLASVKDRVAMTKLISNEKISYCNQEIKNKLSGDTIDLMRILRKKYPQHQFSFIIGSDNLKNFKKWGSWEKLIKTTPFLVFPRPNFQADLKKFALDNPQYQFKIISYPQLKTSNISSTMIRQRIKQGLTINHLLPPKVAEYIKKHQLYQQTKKCL